VTDTPAFIGNVQSSLLKAVVLPGKWAAIYAAAALDQLA